MSSMFCSMDEAFVGPLGGAAMVPLFPGQKPPKQKRRKDAMTVVEPLSGTPAPEALNSGGSGGSTAGPSGPIQNLESGAALQDFFPLPGETAGNEDWTKAFTLEPSSAPGVPAPRFDGSVPVDGKATLWRQIPTPPVAVNELAPAAVMSASAVPVDITQRLDTLTRQLEALTMPAPMQSTAELFLFIAIGLMLLLAIDTLLRFASSMAHSSGSSLMRGGARRLYGGGRRLR
jgi:hypothetical protein